jgi:hypothetical protein
MAFNTIFNGISGSVNESIGQCTFAKDLWMKLDNSYQYKRQDTVDNPIKDMKKINEGKDHPKYSYCNNSKCNDAEFSLANKEEDLDALEQVCVESTNNYLLDEEEDLLL